MFAGVVEPKKKIKDGRIKAIVVTVSDSTPRGDDFPRSFSGSCSRSVRNLTKADLSDEFDDFARHAMV